MAKPSSFERTGIKNKKLLESGEAAARDWLQSEGRENIESLNNVLKQTASSWHDKVQVVEEAAVN